MERLVQPYDAVHHAGLHVIFLPIVLAYTAWVYRVHARPGHAGLDRPQSERLLTPDGGDVPMWYFSWLLGLGLACAFAILNAMWF